MSPVDGSPPFWWRRPRVIRPPNGFLLAANHIPRSVWRTQARGGSGRHGIRICACCSHVCYARLGGNPRFWWIRSPGIRVSGGPCQRVIIYQGQIGGLRSRWVQVGVGSDTRYTSIFCGPGRAESGCQAGPVQGKLYTQGQLGGHRSGLDQVGLGPGCQARAGPAKVSIYEVLQQARVCKQFLSFESYGIARPGITYLVYHKNMLGTSLLLVN